MPTSRDPSDDSATGVLGLVSVIIPTYNRASIVGRAIESALGQTYAPVEVIVIDDGSADGTGDLVRRYDSRVIYLPQPNAGVSAARNTGLRAARGEFIAFLDSDDQWLPWKVELQVRFLRAFPEVGMVWTDMQAVNREGQVIKDRYLRDYYSAYSRTDVSAYLTSHGCVSEFWPQAPGSLSAREFRHGDLFPAMFLGNLVHTSTVLLRRERFLKVKGFDVDLKVSGEDWDFHLRTCRQGPVGFVDVSSIYYRVEGADRLSGPTHLIEIATNNLKTLERCLRENGPRITLPPGTIRRQMGDAYFWLGEVEVRQGSNYRAMRHLCRGLAYAPLQSSGWTWLVASLVPPPMFRQGLRMFRALRAILSAARSRS